MGRTFNPVKEMVIPMRKGIIMSGEFVSLFFFFLREVCCVRYSSITKECRIPYSITSKYSNTIDRQCFTTANSSLGSKLTVNLQ